MTENQYRRRMRLIDQQLTMHSLLRDRYAHRSLVLQLVILVGSVVGLTVAASDGSNPIRLLGINASLQTWIAVLSATTFVLTLVDILTDWKQRAWRHEDSANRLAQLKATYGRATVDEGRATLLGVDLAATYDATLAALPTTIPDRAFNRLKARHLRKVAVSRALSASPGKSEFLIRMQVWAHGSIVSNSVSPKPRDDRGDATREESG